MMLNLMNRLGDWNPQLLRELKGRLKVVNLAVAVVISLLGQLVLFLYQLREFPDDKYSMSGPYCLLAVPYQQRLTQLNQLSNQLQKQFFYYSGANFDREKIQAIREQIEGVKTEQGDINNLLYSQFCPSDQINTQLWWRDHCEYIFLTLSVVFIFTLLVAGTYLLINNLAQEEHRGTLNFIRLSPQSETSILTGKLLGVPSLVYLITLLAVPLHLWAGRTAKIALSYVLSFYIVLVASCIFFYSAALLFGLVSRFFSGFQPWLGSGTVLLFLIITMQMASSYNSDSSNSTAWLRLLSPFDITNHLFPNLVHAYERTPLTGLQFFNFPVGANIVSLLGLHLLNYGLWTYWSWQALKRCFRNPNATILSKGQSYLLVACFQVMNLGFSLRDINVSYQTKYNLLFLAFFNLVLLFGLIAVLSPHRQPLQDWARYRHQRVSSRNIFGNNSLLQDLIWGEKSPAILAIAINLVIAATSLVVWILLAPVEDIHVGKIKALLAVALFISLMMIYATLAQSMLLMKTPKRSLLATGTIGAAMFLPPMILQVLGIAPQTNHILWLFSTFPWVGIEYATTPTIFMAFLGELCVLVLLNLHLTRQVRLAGESASKALLSHG